MPSFHKEGLIMYAGISQGRIEYLVYYTLFINTFVLTSICNCW